MNLAKLRRVGTCKSSIVSFDYSYVWGSFQEEMEAQKAMMTGNAIPENVDPEVYEK